MTQQDPQKVEAAAKQIAHWLGYRWTGLAEGRIGEREFPIWTSSGRFQGGKQDLRDLVRTVALVVNGEQLTGSDNG